MNDLVKLVDDYARRSDWRDLALVRFCLAISGLFAGLLMPQKLKKPVAILAVIACIVTYIPLILKLVGVLSIGTKKA